MGRRPEGSTRSQGEWLRHAPGRTERAWSRSLGGGPASERTLRFLGPARPLPERCALAGAMVPGGTVIAPTAVRDNGVKLMEVGFAPDRMMTRSGANQALNLNRAVLPSTLRTGSNDSQLALVTAKRQRERL